PLRRARPRAPGGTVRTADAAATHHGVVRWPQQVGDLGIPARRVPRRAGVAVEPGGRASVPAVPAGDGGAQPTAAGAGPDRHLPGTAGRDAVARADRARAHVSRGGGGRRVERAAARGSGLAGGLLLVPHPGAL